MRSCSGFWVMTPVWGISLVPVSINLRLSQLCHLLHILYITLINNQNTYTFIYLIDKNKYSRYTFNDMLDFSWKINLWPLHHSYCNIVPKVRVWFQMCSKVLNFALNSSSTICATWIIYELFLKLHAMLWDGVIVLIANTKLCHGTLDGAGCP